MTSVLPIREWRGLGSPGFLATLFLTARSADLFEKTFWRGLPDSFMLPFVPMVKGYFADDATRAERVQKLFDTIAPRYDLINNLQSFGLHHHWKRRFVALANPNLEDHAWTSAVEPATCPLRSPIAVRR